MRITTIKFLFVCLCLLTFTRSACAQESTLDTLVSQFKRFREKSLQEKLFAHLDRTFYLTGETLWFKISCVDGTFHKPLGVSKVAYAELLDRSDIPVLQGKIALREGLGDGSFFIPASLTSGTYRFRVYTSWMKNFAPEFYFDQVITIVNPFVAPEQTKPQSPTPCTIDFFPEGGNLVAGLQSNVAYKISGEGGNGESCAGVLLNQEGDTLAVFKPGHGGMGHFKITPAPNARYTARLSGNQRGGHPFPEVHPSGFVMQVRDSGDVVHVSVQSKGVDRQSVYLFVHARQIITHSERQMLSNNRADFILSRKEFQEGISHLTLFTGDFQPVCERLYFTYPQKKLPIDIAGNQKVFTPRKKVSITLKSGAQSNFSMSVYKVDSLSHLPETDIYAYLWLGADLVGTIDSPGYYLNNDKPGVGADMDHLMLTHGWRRFDWKEILTSKPDYRFLPEVREHIVTATITKEGTPQRGVFAQLGSPGKIIRAYGSWSNSDGQSRFEIKDFYGPRRIIIHTRTDSAAHYNIQVEDPFSASFKEEKLPAFKLSPESEDQLVARSIAMQVQDIFYYDAFGNRPVVPVVDSSAFYGQADATYYLDDYTRFQVMEEVMREYVPGVFVRKRRDGFHFIVIDNVHGGVLAGDPMVLLDGVPVLDIDDIMAIDPLLVQKLEVVQRQYYVGQAVFPGIVSYSTYRGDLGGLQPDPRSISLHYEGLQMKRQFHSPVYSRQTESDRMPDQRHLLHWNPNIITDDSGKHQEEFFTSDVPGTYVVVVQGLNKEGAAGSATYTFRVTSPDDL